MKIYLSPSNQTNNMYNDGIHNEQQVCYLIAQKIQDYLSNVNGIDVKLGKPHDTIAQRVKESNQWGADYHIPIHTNAGGGHGCEIYVYKDNINNEIINEIYKNISKLTPTEDRGIKISNSLYEIKYSTGKCCYIETAFHDTEGDWIFNNVDEIAYSVASAIVSKVDKSQIFDVIRIPITKSDNLFHVQLGAFTTLERAESYAKELKNKYGLNTFIKHS